MVLGLLVLQKRDAAGDQPSSELTDLHRSSISKPKCRKQGSAEYVPWTPNAREPTRFYGRDYSASQGTEA
jgi:hypothetical protein